MICGEKNIEKMTEIVKKIEGREISCVKVTECGEGNFLLFYIENTYLKTLVLHFNTVFLNLFAFKSLLKKRLRVTVPVKNVCNNLVPCVFISII